MESILRRKEKTIQGINVPSTNLQDLNNSSTSRLLDVPFKTLYNWFGRRREKKHQIEREEMNQG